MASFVPTDKQDRILAMAPKITGSFTVLGMSNALGEIVSIRDVQPLVEAGLLAEEAQPAPPPGEKRSPRRFYLPSDTTSAPDPMLRVSTDLTPEEVARIHARFEKGDADEPGMMAALCDELGINAATMDVLYKQWQVAKRTAAAVVNEVTEPEATTPAEDQAHEPVAAPKRVRITGEIKERLWARFDAGEGSGFDSKMALSKEFGVSVAAITGQKTEWGRARKRASNHVESTVNEQLTSAELQAQARPMPEPRLIPADILSIVSPKVAALYSAELIRDADTHARALVLSYRLDDSHRGELIERILDRGAETVAREVAADRAAMDGLKSKAKEGRQPTQAERESFFRDLIEPTPAARQELNHLGVTQVNLCDTCLKWDVCWLNMGGQSEAVTKTVRGGNVDMLFGARPVLKCSAYRGDTAAD